MAFPLFNNIGAYLYTQIGPFNNAATAEVDGASVQIVGNGYGFKSAQVACYVGAEAGSPSAISVAFQVEHSATGTGGWSAYTDLQGNGLTTIVAASTQATMNVNLEGADQYVRIAVTPTLTGGSSPSVAVAAALVLGGSTENPAYPQTNY